jgi:pimeloyl-ACP methyl ester carboxylesterase
VGRYVLIHGAWHTGNELAQVAASIRAAGHEPFTPTIRGNRPGDPKTIGLAQAIRSIADYLVETELSDVVLVGHSYGGMIITGVADTVPERIRRLVYWNAFVPNDGESVSDMLPPILAKWSCRNPTSTARSRASPTQVGSRRRSWMLGEIDYRELMACLGRTAAVDSCRYFFASNGAEPLSGSPAFAVPDAAASARNLARIGG